LLPAGEEDPFPRLIRCAVTGYGGTGPYAGRKAFDLLVQGEAGVTMSTGEPGAPAKPGVSLGDLAGGAYATIAILGALLERERTGRGKRLEIAMFDALADWMSPLLLAWTEAGRLLPPTGTRHASIVPYGPCTCRNGAVVNIAVQNDGQWRRLTAGALGDDRLAGDPRFATNAGRLEHRDEVEAAVQKLAGTLDLDTLCHRLDENSVPWGRLNGVVELAEHPLVTTRLAEAVLPGGGRVGVPAGALGEPGAAAAVPALGEHTAQILGELGLLR
jgi:itaconate CoA-transferase